MLRMAWLLYRHIGRAADVLKESEHRHEVVPDETAFFSCSDAVSADVADLRGMKSNCFFRHGFTSLGAT
jgi:hypothetical protein